MKANDIILYSDMDGTALTDWSLGPVVPEENLRLIRKFVDEGGSFSVASGRQAGIILRYFPGVSFSAPLVCGNGAVVYDARSGRFLRRILVPQSYKRESLEYMLSRPEVWIVAANERGIWQVLTGDPVRDAGLKIVRHPGITAGQFLEQDFVKVVYVSEEAQSMERVRAETEALPSAGLVCALQSGPQFLEVMERSVNKASGVACARAAAGMEGRTLVCIGDYFNDLAMLQAADIAACPRTSPREIRDICQIVTCGNNEGAVGDLIRQLKLW